MRKYVIRELIDYVENLSTEIKTVAIVGGSPLEPELLAIREIIPNIESTFFGIDTNFPSSNFEYLDLNKVGEFASRFDLVLCSKVLEHVWNTRTALDNLKCLLEPKTGILWINCPASDKVHGSPDYYSAGYSVELFEKYAELLELEILRSGQVGSKRTYFFTHILQYWANDFELSHPLLSFRPLKSYGKRIISKTLAGLGGRLFSMTLSNRVVNSGPFVTETFVLLRTRE